MKTIYILAICLVVFVVVIYYVTRPSYPQLDTFYVQSVDVDGNNGYTHDIGTKPSELVNNTLKIQLLKTEIINGVKKEMGQPKYLKIGHHPQDLKLTVYPQKVEEDDLFYSVDIKL